MNDLLQPLEGFLIGAIPTIILFLLLWFLYRILVHDPLKGVLDERRELTEGALARAKANISKAEEKTHDYEQKIQQAKLAVFKAQEERRKQLAAQREEALGEARSKAQELVRANRQAIEKQLAETRQSLDRQGETLAAEVIRAVLKPVAAAPAGGRS
jgi:F0F1-type ATP synthase membrane subunit b/b'